MIPHTATPAPMAVTTVLSAVTLLVKNAMIVFSKILIPEFVLKLGTILDFLLPKIELFTLLPEGIKIPASSTLMVK